MTTNNEFKRRNRIDLNTPVELKIREAFVAVEDMGADPRLTEAAQLIDRAREIVADCIEGAGGPIAMPNPKLAQAGDVAST